MATTKSPIPGSNPSKLSPAQGLQGSDSSRRGHGRLYPAALRLTAALYQNDERRASKILGSILDEGWTLSDIIGPCASPATRPDLEALLTAPGSVRDVRGQVRPW